MNLLSLVQVLGDANPVSDKYCHGFIFLVKIIRKGVFPILQIGIPIILIVLGTLDLAKAVIASDEKQVKEAQGKLIKRCIYAIAVFFIVTLVNVILSMVATTAGKDATGITDWRNCWNHAK